MQNKDIVHILSGGLDSTVLLYHLIANDYNIKAVISYNYGQRHKKELQAASNTIHYLHDKFNYSVPHHIIDLSEIGKLLSISSLTSKDVDVPEGHYADENMKLTVVPNRNMTFLSVAAMLAVNEKANLSIGIHAGDHCFSKDTNILTLNGLKKVEDLNKGDVLYSFNQQTNEWEEDSVVDVIKKNVVKNINKINTYAGYLRLTDEHEVYRLKLSDFHPVHGYSKSIEKIKVKDLNEGDYLVQPTSLRGINELTPKTIDLLPLAKEISLKYEKGLTLQEEDGFLWLGGDSVKYKSNKIPRYIDTTSFINLMAWYIAEGCSQKDSYKVKGSMSRYSANIYQSLKSNLSKVEIIIKDFESSKLNCKFEFSKVLHNNIPKEVTFYVSNITAMFMKECGSHSEVKHIPNWLFEILLSSYDLRESFLYTLALGDGFDSAINGMGFCSTSQKLIEQVITLIQLSGYHFTEQKSQGKTKYITYSKLGNKRALISLGNAKFTEVKSIKVEDYNDHVYDISVKNNHNFLAGQYGSLLISNSIYPDCRMDFVASFVNTVRIGNWGAESFDVITPFLFIDKGNIVKKGLEAAKVLNIDFNVIFENTWTCYKGLEKACGKCGSCVERLEAFESNGITDPLVYNTLKG